MADLETIHIARAAASLGDRYADHSVRLAEIERALKLDPDREYRRQLRREYLDLTDLVAAERLPSIRKESRA